MDIAQSSQTKKRIFYPEMIIDESNFFTYLNKKHSSLQLATLLNFYPFPVFGCHHGEGG